MCYYNMEQIVIFQNQGVFTLLAAYVRYVDMIANPEVVDTFRKRAKVS